MFQNFEFYIVNFNIEFNKKELETIIHANSGRIVQNLLDSTTHIIACKEDFKTKNLEKMSYNIISHNWILEC